MRGLLTGAQFLTRPLFFAISPALSFIPPRLQCPSAASLFAMQPATTRKALRS